MRGLILVCALGASAAADPAPPSQADAAYADQLAEAGALAVKRGDQELAIAAYEKAYALVPLVEFVLDIAQAHQKLARSLHATDPAAAAEHRDKARARFREVLDAHPAALYAGNSAIEGYVRDSLAALDQQWAEEHPKEEAARAAAEQRKNAEVIAAEDARRAEQARREALEQQRTRDAIAQTRRDRDHDSAHTLEVGGLVAAGVGVVGLGLGVGFGIRASNASGELGAGSAFDQSVFDRGNNAEQAMAIAYVAGGVLVVGGAVAWWIGHRRIAALAIGPSEQGRGVAVAGRF